MDELQPQTVEPSCEPSGPFGLSSCTIGGTGVAVSVALVLVGAWVLSELLGAWKSRKLRKIAEASDPL